jgi:hypothetical protein
MKAQLRDANLQAKGSTLLADNSGKVYRKAPAPGAKAATRPLRETKTDRGTEPMTAARALQQRSGGATYSAQKQAGQKRAVQNRAMPAPAKGVTSDKGMTAAQAVKRMDRGAPKAAEQLGKSAAPRQATAPVQQKAAPAWQKAAPAWQKAAPAWQKAAPVRQAQFAPADSRNAWKASTVTGQAGGKNLGSAVRQKSYSAFSAPARQAPARAAVDQAAPRMDQAAPRMDQAAPRMDQAAPRMDQAAPRMDQAAPRGNERSAGGPRGDSARYGSRRGERD